MKNKFKFVTYTNVSKFECLIYALIVAGACAYVTSLLGVLKLIALLQLIIFVKLSQIWAELFYIG